MEQHSADHRRVMIARLRLYALTAVGGFLIVYQLLPALVPPEHASFHDLGWILVCISMYVMGVWLAWRLPRHPQAVRLLVVGTAFFATSAFGSLMASQPQLTDSPWAAVLSMLSLKAQAAGAVAATLLIGSYPD